MGLAWPPLSPTYGPSPPLWVPPGGPWSRALRILLQPGSANGPQSYIHTNLALHRRRWMLSQRNFPLLAGLHTPCLLLTSSDSLHRLPLNCARPYLPIRHTWGCFNPPPPLYPLVACAAQMSLPETYAHFPSIVTPPVLLDHVPGYAAVTLTPLIPLSLTPLPPI